MKTNLMFIIDHMDICSGEK